MCFFILKASDAPAHVAAGSEPHYRFPISISPFRGEYPLPNVGEGSAGLGYIILVGGGGVGSGYL